MQKYDSQVVLAGCKSSVLKRIPEKFYNIIKVVIQDLNNGRLPKDKLNISNRLTELALIGHYFVETATPEQLKEIEETIKKDYDNPTDLFRE